MVGETTLDHAGVVSIEGKESVGELAHVKTTVTSLIVSGDEEVELLASREDTDGGETFSKLDDRETSIVVGVEDLESIRQVEVSSVGKSNLLSFDVVLSLDKLAETIDKFILVP